MTGKLSQKIAVFFAALVLVVSLLARQPIETALLRAFATWIVSSTILFLFSIMMSRLAVSALKTEHARRNKEYLDWVEEQRKREAESANPHESGAAQ